MTGTILLVAGGLLLLVVIAIYNRLVRLRNRTDNAWAQVDVQLKRRYDLIPNLVESVKGYAATRSRPSKRSPAPAPLPRRRPGSPSRLLQRTCSPALSANSSPSPRLIPS